MEYKIEQIGAQFSDKDIKILEKRLNHNAESGYKFHTVFQISKPGGCMGVGSPSITNLAVFVKE
jgi:hypothetical protein